VRKVIVSKKAVRSKAPLSQAFRAGNFIFTSGQVARDPKTGDVIEGDITAQTKRALENVRVILKAAGASLEDVVKVTVVLSNMNDFEKMNEVYRTFFSKPFPARSLVGGNLSSPKMKVEIEAIAYVEDKDSP